MNIFQKIFFYFNKFLFPILLLLVGIVLFVKGMEVEEVKNTTMGDIKLKQTDYFRYGSYAVFAMAIIALLFVMEVINRTVSIILAFTVLPVTAAVMLYFSANSVLKPMHYKEYKEEVYYEAKQRLKDIRNAQLEYKVKYRKYAPTFDELIRFLKEDEVAEIRKVGTPPDRKMTTKEAYLLGKNTVTVIFRQISEKEAARLGEIYRNPENQEMLSNLMTSEEDREFMEQLKGIVRDTNMVSVQYKIFESPTAKKRQSKWDFVADSIPYMPYGEGRFVLRTDSIQKGEEFEPVFEVRNDPPMYYFNDIQCMQDSSSVACKEKTPKDTLIMGSLTSTKTNGNWK